MFLFTFRNIEITVSLVYVKISIQRYNAVLRNSMKYFTFHLVMQILKEII